MIFCKIVGTLFFIVSAILAYTKITIPFANISFSASLIFVAFGAFLLLPCFLEAINTASKPNKDSQEKLHIKTLPILVAGFILLAGVVIGIILGEVFIPSPGSGTTPDYTLFKDTLVTTLTVMSLALAIFGTLLFVYIRNKLQQIAKFETEERGNFISAELLNAMSFSFWNNYKSTKDKSHLGAAIAFVDRAFKYFDKITDCETKECIELVCRIRNNWGYYLAIRGNSEDKELSLKCSEYLKKHIGEYPHRAKRWQDTIETIEKAYLPPKNNTKTVLDQ